MTVARVARRVGHARQSVQKTANELADLDYIEFVDAKTLTSVKQVTRGTVLAGAVFFGKTRLIDNLWFR